MQMLSRRWGYKRERDICVAVKMYCGQCWTPEYVKSLRERHNLKHQKKRFSLKVGDVVLIQDEQRNRGKWNIGVVVTLIKGRDGELHAARWKGIH